MRSEIIIDKTKIKFSQISLVIIGDGVTYGVNFLSIMVLARLLPVDTMGTYNQLIYLGAFFIQLFEAGITNSIYRFWNTLELQSKFVFSKMILIFLFISGFIAAVLLIFLSTKLAIWYQNPDLEKFVRIIALYPLATMITMIVRPIMISDGHSIMATGIETIFALLSFFALLIPVYLNYPFEDSLQIWIYVLYLRLLFVPLLTHKYLLQKSSIIDKELIRDVINYVWPIQAARAPGILMRYFDKIFMSLFLTPFQFAIYSLGAREIPYINSIGYSVSNVLIPELVRDYSRNDIEQLLSKWKSACRKTALITYLPLAFCVVFSEKIINFFFTNTYFESTLIFRIFACITFFRVIEYASLAKTIGESKLILNVAIAGLATILIFAYPMSRMYGALGMALVVLMSTLVSVIYFLAWYVKYFKVPLQSIFPLEELLLFLLYSFISTGFIKFASNHLENLASSNIFQLFFQILLLFISSLIIFACFVYLDNRIRHKMLNNHGRIH